MKTFIEGICLAIIIFVIVMGTAFAGSETWGQPGATEHRDPNGPIQLWYIPPTYPADKAHKAH